MEWFKGRNIEEILLFKALEAKRDGTIKLPLYQRDAVWSEGRICALWDSLLRGYPLPSFLLVRGKGKSREFQNHSLEAHGQSIETSDNYYDLLDGQQRMAAIDAVFSFKKDSVIRLWLDLAPGNRSHPLKFKYWIHACNKIFPFGFRMEANGEHDFAVLHDNEISDLWDKLNTIANLKEKEFYDLPLIKTFPYKAECPVPLDELIQLVSLYKPERDQLIAKIIQLSNEYMVKTKEFLKDENPPDNEMVKKVADGLLRLYDYALAFQLIKLDEVGDEDDDYTLFERIGRGGVQITQRQLAVSKLMLALGKDGNNVVSKFQNTKELQHLLETEDIIHGLARVAFSVTESDADTDGEAEETRINRDLLELTPERLKSIQKDNKRWTNFLNKLKEYCVPISSENPMSRLQQAYTRLYADLRYRETENPNGFSLLQLAQPDREGEGISPITLHPLLYWYMACSNSIQPDRKQREEMIRWILFANGFATAPKHAKLNREAFRCVLHSKRVDFSEIKQHVFGDRQLREDLGFSWNKPVYENGEIIEKEYPCPDDIPNPEVVTNLTARRLILRNWPESRLKWFVLLWNQREAMEHFYGKISYIPALFSKGRPFDADHIVARNRLLYDNSEGISDDSVRSGLLSLIRHEKSFTPIIKLRNEIVSKEPIKLLGDSFRKNFPNLIANYRYWPKRLNRSDGDKTVKEKTVIANVQQAMMGHPLAFKFKEIDDAHLWQWSTIPLEDKEVWQQLPPENEWNEEFIGKFVLAVLRREYFLYNNAYNFILNKDVTWLNR